MSAKSFLITAWDCLRYREIIDIDRTTNCIIPTIGWNWHFKTFWKMPSQLEALRWTPHFLQCHLDNTYDYKHCLLGGYISPIPPMKGTRNNHWFLGGQDGSALAYGCDEFRTEFLALSRLFLYEMIPFSPTSLDLFFVIFNKKTRKCQRILSQIITSEMYVFCCSFWESVGFSGPQNTIKSATGETRSSSCWRWHWTDFAFNMLPWSFVQIGK